MIVNFQMYDRWLAKHGLNRDHLPHLSVPLYEWAFDFIMSNKRKKFVCGANQISKSSSLIRMCIYYATMTSIWPKYFNRRPKLFWYFYPSTDVVKEEWATKWDEWMPRIPEDHPLHKQFGWKVTYKKKDLPESITFNTGVRIGFRYYEQKTDNFQASTVDFACCDEEPPEKHIGEIMARLTNTDGMFAAAFTATKGQAIWHRCLERIGKPDELYPDAFKRLVSLFMCMKYCNSDAPAPWTHERIQKQIAKYHDDLEVQKRVYGRFVGAAGKAFYAYQSEKTRVPDHVYRPELDEVFGVVDPGSGGRAHPAAILILSQRGHMGPITVLSAWRGDLRETTSNDILKQLMEMAKGLGMRRLIYDFASKDFFLTASRELDKYGVELITAKKDRESGFERVNSYLEAGAIRIPETKPEGVLWWKREEIEKLHEELNTVLKVDSVAKRAGDDLTDCLRYGSMTIDVDLALLNNDIFKKKKIMPKLLRRGRHEYYEDEFNEGREDEEAYWAEQYTG